MKLYDDEIIYKFKDEVMEHINADLSVGVEQIAPYFKINYDSGMEIPPFQVYLFRETLRGKIYRQTLTYMNIFGDRARGDMIDTRSMEQVFSVADIVKDEKDIEEFNNIRDNVIVEEVKTRLTDKHYYVE